MIDLMQNQITKVFDLNKDMSKELSDMDASIKKVALLRDQGF
jgi:hypothetical protein